MERLFNLDLASASDLIDAAATGAIEVLDFSSLDRRPAAHLDLLPFSVVGWWMLGAAERTTAVRRLVMPGLGSPPARMLARSGLPLAAHRLGWSIEADGQAVTLDELLRGKMAEPQLPNVNWSVMDDLKGGDRLRAVPDLEDVRRAPPPPVPLQGNRRYPWIDGLRAASKLDAQARRRFNADADQVLYEAISNVHAWAQADRAIAVVSVTKGGGERSFNRLHAVVADDGRGIVSGVEWKRAKEGVVERWQDDVEQCLADDRTVADLVGKDLELALLVLLVREAFSSRAVGTTQDGHGLHACGVLGKRWGVLEVVTSLDPKSGEALHVRLDNTRMVGSRLVLPGARGTLVHAQLDASPEREREYLTAPPEQAKTLAASHR